MVETWKRVSLSLEVHWPEMRRAKSMDDRSAPLAVFFFFIAINYATPMSDYIDMLSFYINFGLIKPIHLPFGHDIDAVQPTLTFFESPKILSRIMLPS